MEQRPSGLSTLTDAAESPPIRARPGSFPLMARSNGEQDAPLLGSALITEFIRNQSEPSEGFDCGFAVRATSFQRSPAPPTGIEVRSGGGASDE
jgi:hypothetical protein